ncbi:hypothetical protein GTP56_28280 [Duganella sp. FT134W]|uniref:Toxin-antitoxin system YwqK family antitoxin n=1 Tax=Duganella margarita TaxID=2692170 RepID=A0A7X4H754_9BURK|nr:hypothetical protein [Duganella margarita]MYM76066.1 hypothetical protein [Duganella margarita]
MRKLVSIPVFLLSLVLSGCNDTLDFRNAEVSNNKIYQTGKNEGFSGKITNIPLSKIPFGDLVPVANLIAKVTGNKDINNLLYGASLTVGHDTVLCDTSSNNGSLEGEALCKDISSKNQILRFNFKNNLIDGKTTFYYVYRKDVLLADVTYNNGKASGLLTVYGFATGKPIYKVELENGIPNGAEKAFDENSGQVTFEGDIRNGKYEGSTARYSADGTLIEKLDWKNGEIQQVAKTKNMADSNACLDGWTAAFHKEQGVEAAVSMEQIDEWKGWCLQGKQPGTN